MPKVITGAGLQEFIESGKHETITADKSKASKNAPPLEVKSDKVTELGAPAGDDKHRGSSAPADVKSDRNQTPSPQEPPGDDGLEPEDKDLSEIIRKKIGKKHRAMKEAQEAAADAESFAKAQFDERRLIEGERDTLKRELEEAKKARQEAPKEPELKKPELKDFTDEKGQPRWTEYTEATADYAAKKAVADERSRQQSEALKKAQDLEAAEKAEAAKKFKEKADKIDGFQEKLAGSSVWFPNAVLEYITESEDGPEIVLALLDDPVTADRISKLRPIKAIAEIGKLQKTLGQAKAVTPAAKPVVEERGGAPPPITPISGMGSGTINTDPAKMSFRELREYERAKRKKH